MKFTFLPSWAEKQTLYADLKLKWSNIYKSVALELYDTILKALSKIENK